jgi:spermidine synthase
MRRFVPILLLLFVGSGCAALIYEVVWFQLLQFVIGSSAVSLGVLLGVYMGGMCLGSLLFPRFVSSTFHPILAFAVIEICIGICGLAVLYIVPRLDLIYSSIAAGGSGSLAIRALICVVCLLPPTLLMGASLPAMARYFEASKKGVSWLGYFYGGNIAGAVLGSLLAGFYLLRLYDMTYASHVAVAINLIVGAAGILLARMAEYKPSEVHQDNQAAHSGDNAILLTIAISGFVALGAEVVWTRLLSMMLGATVYTFSIILAIFLAGLGIGSSMGATIGRRIRSPGIVLGICQLLLACTVAWAAYAITNLVGGLDFYPSALPTPRALFMDDLQRAAWVVLPSAVLWGASFPLALSAFATRDGDAGLLVGTVYAANTVGGIFGAAAFSLVLIPTIGTTQSEQLLIALSAVAAIVVVGSMLRRQRVVAVLTIALVATAATVTVEPVPWRALAFGRLMNESPTGAPLYIGEGMNASIVVSGLPNGVRYFHVSGKVEATTEPYDMRLQRMLGHLSALLARRAEDILVVGFGAGVTAGSFVKHPEVRHIVIDELEPLVPPASTKFFADQNYDVLHDPRVEIHYDDARHFILTSDQKFDVITSDPIHPWVKGMAALYSKEYFELCKRHLKPGGVVTQWIPLYENDFETIRTEIATFFAVFPHATLWTSDVSGKGYDLVAVGQIDPEPIDVDALEQHLHRTDHVGALASMKEVGLGSTLELLATYAGREEDLRPWLLGATINTDMNMRLQYLAGWSVNFNHPDLIYAKIASYRSNPTNLFVGKEPVATALRDKLGGAGEARVVTVSDKSQ